MHANAYENPLVAVSASTTLSNPPFSLKTLVPRDCAGLHGPRFQAQVIEALNYTAESHLVILFEDANLLVHCVKRVTCI